MKVLGISMEKIKRMRFSVLVRLKITKNFAKVYRSNFVRSLKNFKIRKWLKIEVNPLLLDHCSFSKLPMKV